MNQVFVAAAVACVAVYAWRGGVPWLPWWWCRSSFGKKLTFF